MDIFRWLGAKNKYQARRKRYKNSGKRQLNVVISEGSIHAIKYWANKTEISMAVITEHCIQVGIFHFMQLEGDKERISMLQDHLEKSHMQNKGNRDSENILRLGCERTNIKEFIALVAVLNKSLNLLSKELAAVIENRCTPEERDRIKKLSDIKDKVVFDLAMWTKGFDVKMNSIE